MAIAHESGGWLVAGVLGCVFCFGCAELIDYVAYIAHRSAQLVEQAEMANTKLDFIGDKLDAIAKRDPVVPEPPKPKVPVPAPQRADEPYRL